MRPAPLSEVAGPQRSDRTARRSAGDGLPSLGLAALAGASGEAVDSAALSFLTGQALQVQNEAKEKEQEEEA